MLWTLNPGAASLCSAVWGHFAISIITVTSNNHPFLFSSETWDVALSSLSLSVFRACNDFCISLCDSFKCFHPADMFAALVLASIWSRNVIIWYKLFSLFAYSAEHRNSFFSCFRRNIRCIPTSFTHFDAIQFQIVCRRCSVMDLNIFVKNVYIILLSPEYKNITFYGSSHSSHEILTNWLINVDNFVQRQFALLNISNIQIYIYIKIYLNTLLYIYIYIYIYIY